MSATFQEPIDRTDSFASTKSRSTVYQTNGKPLSEEAIYKAKLKYGVYNKPGAPVVGVQNSASDSAALLATQTDLSVQPYKRNLSAEAATAALIAKTDSAPKAWKRENFAPDAEYAAISAKSSSYPFEKKEVVATTDDRDSSDAASFALKKKSSTLAREALEDLYAFDDIRNGTQSFTQFDGQTLKQAAESSVSMSMSSAPKTDYRSGLTSDKNKTTKMNIGDVHKQSSLNATKTMSSRTTPTMNVSRSGLVTTKKLDSANGEVNISKITLAANESARKSLHARLNNNTKDYRSGIPTASDYSNKSLASSGAGASLSLNKDGFADYAAMERASLKNNTLVNKSVYAIAAQNTDRTLTMLNNDAATKNMFNNREVTLQALQIAQANLAKRNENSGKVNLGGGLLMDPKELHQLASSIVQPVLTDIDSKAVAQRTNDYNAAKQKEEQKLKREEYQQEQKRLKMEAVRKKEDEKRARKEKLTKEKEAEKEKQDELIKQKTGEVKAQEDVMAEKNKEHDAEQEELLSEKLEAEKALEEKAAAKKAERDEELKNLQAEKDEDVAPILESYAKETAILDDLIAKREAAEKLAAEQKARADTAEASLTELNKELEETVSKIDVLKEEVTALKETSAKETSEAELMKKETEADIQTKQVKEQEYVANNEKLLAEKTDLQAKRATALVSLQEAKKSALEEELAINNALPEHLQKTVDQDLSDESDLDEDQFNTTEEEEEEIADTADEPSVQIPISETPVKTVIDGSDEDAIKTGKVSKQTKPTTTTTETGSSPRIQLLRKNSVKKTVETPSKKSWRSKMKGILLPTASSKSSSSSPVEKTSKIPSSPKTTTTSKTTGGVKSSTKKTDSSLAPPESTTEKNELKQTFSGFSQGSLPEEDEGVSTPVVADDSKTGSILNDGEKSKNATGVFKEDI